MKARRILPFLFLFLLPVLEAHATGPDPAALRKQIESARLDPSGAVVLKKVKLVAGLATLTLDGLLVPSTAVGGRAAELVFLGEGRMAVEPPDAIEAGQLDLFTGGERLDEPFQEAVLIIGLDPAVEALLKKPKAGAIEPERARRAEEVFATWKKSPERKLLNVERGIFVDAIGDPFYQGYFAGWFRGVEQGEFLYLVEPDSQEQVTLGKFVPLEATAKEKRKLVRQLESEQRRGRLIGLEVEDLGQWDTWLSAALRNREGKPTPGAAAFEPEKYTLEVAIAERDLTLEGKARVDLKPVVPGCRVATLRLNRDLEVRRVTDAAGADLFFLRSGAELTVLLPAAPPPEATAAVVVEYAGKVLLKEGRRYSLLDTQDWYPHAGSIDRAPYDVTFRWPRRLDLLASGRRIEGGESPDGSHWERRVQTLSTWGFSFEVGRFKTESLKAGHVTVTLAFDPDGSQLGRDVRQEIAGAVTDSLAYYEDLFGPYPLDEITVLTVPRGFSQSMLGFVTLSDWMMIDLDVWNLILGIEDRRTVIAHEIAHQWWGHAVGWASYRDQWISEAMANYAAVLFAKHRLKAEDGGKGEILIGPTSGWQDALTDVTPDGRTIESVGPVVLGTRLFSSRAGDAYQPIVYKKGAVVLDMLARSLGEEAFPKVLREMVRVVANRAISTEDFLSIIERVTGTSLEAFARQYIHGTGLPEVYYDYRFVPREEGKWAIQGTARQQAPYRFRYRVVKAADGGLDVARERLDQIEVAGSSLVVPVQIPFHDPGRPEVKGARKERGRQGPAANATMRGHILLRGASSPIDIPLDFEPHDFFLDRNAEVFGRFFNQSRAPKRVLYYQGLDALAAGKLEEAEVLYTKALAAPVAGEDAEGEWGKSDIKRWGRNLDAEIQLELARLHLDRGDLAAAQGAFDKAYKVLAADRGGWVEEEIKVLASRLDMRRGDFDKPFKRLRKGLLKSGSLDSTEGYVLLAIAARKTGDEEVYKEAVKAAKEKGADLALLTGG